MTSIASVTIRDKVTQDANGFDFFSISTYHVVPEIMRFHLAMHIRDVCVKCFESDILWITTEPALKVGRGIQMDRHCRGVAAAIARSVILRAY